MKKSIKAIIACAFALGSVCAVCACGQKAQPSKKYTVSFDTRGGSEINSISLSEGSAIKRPEETPTKDMFVFDDWYQDESYKQKFDFSTKMPGYNIVIYAGWRGEQSVTVTFDANGGEYQGGATLTETFGKVGDSFTQPQSLPTKFGYSFGGWYTDAECTQQFTSTKYPEENTTLYAHWATDSAYAYINYYVNGDLELTQPIIKGQQATEPDIFDEYMECGGWFSDAELSTAYTFGAVNSNVDLYCTAYTKGLIIENGVVTGYDGQSDKVIIPSSYQGVKVTEVGEYAFLTPNEFRSISSVDIPATVTKISTGAFYNCTYLVNVAIPSGVERIGDNAFFRNERLKTLGDLSGVKSIGVAAFIGCKALRTVELPATLTSLGSYAFAGCELLNSIVVPRGVNVLNEYLFSDCKNLETVFVESRYLNTINEHVFDGCTALKQVTLRSLAKPVFAGVTTTNRVSPFAYCYDVKIYVPEDALQTYVHDYGDLDDGNLKDKFEAIK